MTVIPPLFVLGERVRKGERSVTQWYSAAKVLNNTTPYWRQGCSAQASLDRQRFAATRFQSERDPRIDKALDSKGGRTFTWFADGFAQARILDDRAVFADRRYGLVSAPHATPFLAVGTFDDDGELVRITQQGGLRGAGENTDNSLNLRRELREGWNLMWGLEP